jgi:hypothetical protein
MTGPTTAEAEATEAHPEVPIGAEIPQMKTEINMKTTDPTEEEAATEGTGMLRMDIRADHAEPEVTEAIEVATCQEAAHVAAEEDPTTSPTTNLSTSPRSQTTTTNSPNLS